jgi:hypothetical protein
MSKVPEKYRGYLWSCADHRVGALARRDAALSRARSEGLIVPVQIDMGAWLRDAG